jgi:RNA-binding protein
MLDYKHGWRMSLESQDLKMTITSKQRAELRAEAHHLVPVAHVGNQGITSAVLASLDDALRTHELIKVLLGKNVDVPVKDAAAMLAENLKADLVQVIGRVVSLYRSNPDLPRKPGAPPPWK